LELHCLEPTPVYARLGGYESGKIRLPSDRQASAVDRGAGTVETSGSRLFDKLQPEAGERTVGWIGRFSESQLHAPMIPRWNITLRSHMLRVTVGQRFRT
jgi:hypothetical protein